MEYSLEIADRNQELINAQRPLTGNALQSIKDFYRVSLTYTSNALEGNTLTESETKVILEDGLTVAGHPLRELYEVTGHAGAYDFMWEQARRNLFSIEDIKQLHFLFYKQIDEKNAGVFRSEDVIISGSAYPLPSWREVPAEMFKFIDWSDKAREELHPIIFAAELHRRFVYIHPFIDGNGRTARLIMNLALLQAGYEILTIGPPSRLEYISCLEKGHTDPTPFNEFIIDREVESQKDMIRYFHLDNK